MSAEEVRRRSFSTAFRGFDQAEVRDFLDRVAEELDDNETREKELRAELREARDRVLHPRLDEDTLTSALGEEAAKILRSAHEAAADVRRKAEEHAARVLGEAHQEGERIRGAAQTVLGERTAEAEAAAGAIRAAAETDAAAVIERARRQAEAALEDARSRCESLAADAEDLKGRMLGELARRRRVMNAQVEQLGAGRDTLMRALNQVRSLLDQSFEAVERVATEAKSAAADARQRALAEPEPDVAELEREAGSSLTAPLEGLSGVLADLERSLSALAAEVPVPPSPERAPGPGEAAPSAPEQAGTDREAPTTGAAPAAAAEPVAPEPVAPEPVEGAAAEHPGSEAGPASPEDQAPAAADRGEEPEEPSESERRGSLRLLRRGRPRPLSEPVLSHPPVPDEGIRLIPTPRPEPEPEAEPVPVAAASAPPEPVAAPPSAAVPGTAPADAAVGEPEGPEPATTVDELFARLRAEREAAKQEAHAVLAAEASGGRGGAGESVTPASEEEAVSEVPDDLTVEPDTEASEAPLLEARNRVLAPVHERLARRLKRTLQDDQNDILDRVRARSRGRTGPLLPSEEEHQATYASAVGPLVDEAFRAGGTFAAVFFGVGSAPEGGPNGMAGDLAGEVVGQLRGRLGALGGEGDAEEGDLADAASAVYRAWKGERVESLAMDYAVASFTAGLLAAVPTGTALRWVVDDDGGPCPDCDDNALAGPTPAGDPFPTGQRQPPAHPGCRCLLAPALP